MLRVDAVGNIQVPHRPLTLAPANSVTLMRVLCDFDGAESRILPSAVFFRIQMVVLMVSQLAAHVPQAFLLLLRGRGPHRSRVQPGEAHCGAE